MATGRVPTTANSPLTAKGDLFTYSTAPARLAVGSNGDSLVADSSTATGLRYQENYAAGKNAFINGAFNVWQRGTSFAQTDSYCADRWQITFGGAAPTAAAITQQTFTPGSAPVAGYESQFFLRMVTTTIGSCTAAGFQQLIEDVRTFAGETVTISFWAKADAARTLSVITRQNFGSGGSTATFVEAGTVSATTAWTRFSVTYAVPSVSGKTIGTSSFLGIGIRMTTVANGGTLDLWGAQVEAGSVATAFQTATGTIQGELAACQRYYVRFDGASYAVSGYGTFTSATNAVIMTPLPSTMRIAPSAVDWGTLSVFEYSAAFTPSAVTMDTSYTNPKVAAVNAAITGATAGRSAFFRTSGSTAGYIGYSAEL